MSTLARRPGSMVLTLLAIMLIASHAQGQSYKIIHFFAAIGDGDLPTSTLVLDAEGNLYGTTEDGYFQCGNVFKFSPNHNGTWTETVLSTFDCSGSAGAFPYGGVIFDKAGNLYGTTETSGPLGAGTVFKLSPNPDRTWTRTLIHSFNGADGALSLGGLVFDASGNLYGTTCLGGANGSGTVFQLKPQSDGSWTESVLYSFQGGADGYCPYAGVVFDGAGNNLYGTTSGGGVTPQCTGCGVVFQLRRSENWSEHLLYSFTGGADGSQPLAGVTWSRPDRLYGTTEFGGTNNHGVVFQLALANGSWTESVIHTFTGPDGSGPQSCLVLDGRNLYGTTQGGGTGQGLFAGGTVYKLEQTDGGWTERVLHSFNGPPLDGGIPYAGVTLQKDSSSLHIFGTTWRGGPEQCTLGCGSVYEITR